jgi:phosphatidylglycerophosphate synthase
MITRAQDFTVSADQEQAAWAGVQLLLLALLWAGTGLSAVGWVAGTAFTVALWVLLASALHRSRVRALRPADHVTMARAVLVGGVFALVADGRPIPMAVFVTLAAVALALDGVDGQVARRTGTASPLGARFDMEVDAFLILVLSVHMALALGWWVLAIGALRYLFVAMAWVLPWLRGELPASFARKVVAAVQGIALVVAGVVPPMAGTVVVGLALASLLWSFGRDVRWLWRNRPAQVEHTDTEDTVTENTVAEDRVVVTVVGG